MMFSNEIVAINISCCSFLLNHSCVEAPIISYFRLVFFCQYASILRFEFSPRFPSYSRKGCFSIYFELFGELNVKASFVEVVMELILSWC